MSIFPLITHLDELKHHVEHLPEIRFSKQPNGTTIVCAMISNSDTYSGPSAMWARECRGITFDSNDKLICRPITKFFNVGERPDTHHQVLPWTSTVRKMDKRDGSVINPVIVNGAMKFKSKKSFTSDRAVQAEEFASLNDRRFSWEMLSNGFTPTFELTSPYARIVMKYPTSKLTLLHVRENTTGRYLDKMSLMTLAEEFQIDLVSEYSPTNWTWAEDKAYLETVEGIEGYVYQFENGDMVKAKSKWYLDRHHAMTALTYRNVAELVVAEGIDDLKSHIVEMGEPDLLEKIEHIEHEITRQVSEMADFVETIVRNERHLERKEFAMKFKELPGFGLLMKAYEGKEPNYLEFYARHHLKNDWEVLSL